MKFEFTISELQRMSENRWLTDRERTVFDLFYRRGWRIEDIAAEIDCNRSTISRTLKSIRTKSIKII